MAQDTKKAEIGLNESPFYLASSAEIFLAAFFIIIANGKIPLNPPLEKGE
jgi:hypothetical protein